MFRRCLIAVLALTASATCLADDAAQQRIRDRMAKLFPDEEVTSISETPISGLYEIMLGPSLFYMTGDGRYAVRGDLIDLDQHHNVSDARRAEARKRVFASMDRDEFVEFAPPPGKTRARLYVYTDVDCAYCRKLHKQVPELNAAGIAIDYLAFPRAGPDSESGAKIAAVWCAADRRKAMTAAKSGKTVSAPDCDDPVAAQFALGRSMGVGGTPAVYSADGRELGGYIPAKRLIKMLEEGKI